MFNRSKMRAVRKAGGGHKVAADLALRLPWAGIFEPWRPLVLVAEAAETAELAKTPVRGKVAANRCKKSTRQMRLFDGKLRGVQLGLFPDNAAEKFTEPENFMVPFPPPVEVPMADEDPVPVTGWLRPVTAEDPITDADIPF